MIVQHNLVASNANRMLGKVVTSQSKSTEKLSSGYRINRAADDAAGLSISEKMRGQIRGLNQASTNAQDGISLIQTAEGALTETHSILQRMRELSVQAANGTTTEDDRTAIDDEITQLQSEIDRISDTTEFNTMTLLDGSFSTNFQIGANSGQTMSVSIGDMSVSSLGISTTTSTISNDTATPSNTANTLEAGVYTVKTSAAGTTLDVLNSKGAIVGTVASSGAKAITISGGTDTVTFTSTTLEDGTSFRVSEFDATAGTQVASSKDKGVDVKTIDGATLSLNDLDKAISSVSKQRSSLGAVQNRLEHTISNLDNTSENLQSAESNIRDVDMAEEMVEYTKNNILQQAAQSMLAQANQSNQGVLSLLQ